MSTASKYEILDKIGQGGMGVVFRVRHVELGTILAMKMLPADLATEAELVARFRREARVMARLNHRNIVRVFDLVQEGDSFYLVMEYLQGKNLRDHVKLLAGGRLPVGEALPLLRQAIKGLEEAQRLKVVHRDIKPDNLMLTDRGVLKIADFGIAKPLQEDFSMTLTSELVGTPLAEFIRHAANRGEYGKGDVDEIVAEQLRNVRRFKKQELEHIRPDRTIISIRTSQLPDGERVSGVTFSTASLTSTAQYNGITVHPQGVWLEGTGQLATALADRHRRGDNYTSRALLEQIRHAQHALGGGQHLGGVEVSGGVVAASSLLDTGFGFGYFQVQHVGATSWFVFASTATNPMRWGGLR